MFTLTKKQKLVITSTMALALVLIVAFPCVYASTEAAATTETQSNRTRMLNAKGVAVEKADGQLVTAPAGFSLALEATEVNETIIKFNVVSGSVKINGTEYQITEGHGAVLRDRHVFLLEAQGTSPDGQLATLKLAGRYFWMWGRLYVARVLGSLQAESVRTVLVLRSVIRV
jgi:hypothetical protein